MRIAIGVMGSSTIANPETEKKAEETGRLIAEHSAILITGATNGLPLAAARGATRAGGEVIGFSPAINLEEHKKIGMPVDFHELIVCTGLSFKGRNLLNVRACNGIVFMGGSMGVLNEFTIAYDEDKIIGILEGSGGFCNHLREWMQVLSKPHNRAVLHFNSDPNVLVNDLFATIEKTLEK